MRFSPGDSVTPRAGFGGQWEGEVGDVTRVSPNGEIVDVRFPGQRWDVPFSVIELRHSQQKLEIGY